MNEVTETLFKKYRTAEDYLAVPEDELKADIKPTGFFNQKALSIREACRRIVEVYDGRVPDTMEELTTLRGVARKTANIVLANAYGIVVGIPVDTHVKRLANRIGFSAQHDPDKIEQDLMRLVPARPLVRIQLRADRSRAGVVHRQETPLRRMSDRVPVPVQPGVTYTAGCNSCPSAASRRRARRITRRSSSSSPPQTPASWNVESDHSRQSARTEHPSHTVLASATWARASSGGADREEQLRVLPDAACLGQPPHLFRIVSESPFSHLAHSPAVLGEPAT